MLQKEGKTNIQTNRMIGNVAKEEKLAKNLRAMSRDFSWFSKFFGRTHHHHNSLSVMMCMQCCMMFVVFWCIQFWHHHTAFVIIFLMNAMLVCDKEPMILIIFIFVLYHQCCRGPGSVMLWDKESIKLKFVSAATPSPAQHSGTSAASAARKGQIAVHTCHTYRSTSYVGLSQINCNAIYRNRNRNQLNKIQKDPGDWR